MGRKRTGRRWWLITFDDEDELYFGTDQEAEWFREFKSEIHGKAKNDHFRRITKELRIILNISKNQNLV